MLYCISTMVREGCRIELLPIECSSALLASFYAAIASRMLIFLLSSEGTEWRICQQHHFDRLPRVL